MQAILYLGIAVFIVILVAASFNQIKEFAEKVQYNFWLVIFATVLFGIFVGISLFFIVITVLLLPTF